MSLKARVGVSRRVKVALGTAGGPEGLGTEGLCVKTVERSQERRSKHSLKRAVFHLEGQEDLGEIFSEYNQTKAREVGEAWVQTSETGGTSQITNKGPEQGRVLGKLRELAPEGLGC